MQLKCLIVDDNRVSQTTLAQIVRRHFDCHVECSDDGANALEMIFSGGTDRSYDFICLDVMLPSMDGHTVLRRIREQEKALGVAPKNRLKVIIISALEDCENVLSAFHHGCEAYIAKPFDARQVVDQLIRVGVTPTVLH